jgi:hypothetical protein
MAIGKTVITCAPILKNENERGSVAGHAMTAADYAILGVLVVVPVAIVW